MLKHPTHSHPDRFGIVAWHQKAILPILDQVTRSTGGSAHYGYAGVDSLK
jgi:hypothetical protein